MYSSGTRAAIFTIKAENLPKNGNKSSLRIGYQCDPFVKFFLSDVLVHGGRDYFKKHAKNGVWKFRIRETKLAGHTHAVVSAFDRSDKYGDTEIGSFKFKVEELVKGSVSKAYFRGGRNFCIFQAKHVIFQQICLSFQILKYKLVKKD